MGDIYPSQALAMLREQHDQLRVLADECEALAAPVAADREITTDLRRAVAKLRIAWEAHNRYEESVLAPILLATDAFGELRVEEMVRGHRHEHVLVRSTMTPTTVRELRSVLALLRRHLAEEEAFFLTNRIVRDDLVTLEASG